MGIEVTISTKGQIVIPKDVRDALELRPGEKLKLERVGRRLIIDAPDRTHQRITYDEFRRRIPRHTGAVVAIEDMTVDFDHVLAPGARDS